jgi:plastocyanin
MVHFSTALSLVALYLSAAVALPVPDSAIGDEVGVSAPNGIVMSDTQELNRNRMLSTSSDYPSPTWTDSMPPSSTWSPPAPLSTDGSMDQSLPSYSDSSPSQHTSPPQYGSSSPAYPPQPSPTYGSGSNSWGSNSGGSNPYDDCVQQCQAKYPQWNPSTDSSSGDSSSGDSPTKTGMTHVVWVAPTQGVLRYVPFAVNASVGDTVKFIWGANNHTVTKGSELTPCNATSDSPFATGIQQKGFTFEQLVNDTNPLFVYCAFPGHCEKGMFGIINPPNALGGPSSVGSMMQSMVASNPSLGMMRDYADNATKSSNVASEWGTNFDMSNIPQWAQDSFVENVLFTRTYLAANAGAIQNGEVDTTNPPVIPQDITQVALGNSPSYGYGSNSAGPSSVTSTSTVAPSPTSTGNSNSNLSDKNAASVTRSGFAVVLAAFAAGFFLL